jgi:hypothetical protein
MDWSIDDPLITVVLRFLISSQELDVWAWSSALDYMREDRMDNGINFYRVAHLMFVCIYQQIIPT